MDISLFCIIMYMWKKGEMMNKILKKYSKIIQGWDTDIGIGDNPDEVYYYVWLKRPWVMKINGRVTDATDGFNTLKITMNQLSTAYKDATAWDNL